MCLSLSPCCVPASNNNRPRANPRKIRSAARAAVPSTQLPRTLVRIRKLPCCRRRTSHIGKLNKTRISNVSDIVELLAGSWVQFFLVQWPNYWGIKYYTSCLGKKRATFLCTFVSPSLSFFFSFFTSAKVGRFS